MKESGPLMKRNSWNLAIAFLAVFIGGLFVYFWRYSYNSDFAMIGLIAKRTLETGEQYLFVPKVGYNGLLYEANLVALFFKLFGISPIVLNFAPFVTYLAFCWIFYQAVRAWHTPFVARLSTLLIILSSPSFYSQVLRTQPNYGETYLMGSALILLYKKLVDRVITQGKSALQTRSTLGLLLLFGWLCGFGLYTYGQIVYFIVAIGLHLFLLVYREFKIFATTQEGAQSAGVKRVRTLIKGSLIYSFLGFLSLIFWFTHIRVGSHHIKWAAHPVIYSGFAIAIVSLFAFALLRHFRRERFLVLPFSFLLTGAIIGISPKFYYKWVEHGIGIDRMGIGGSLSEMGKRWSVLFSGHSLLLNISRSSPFSWIGGAFVVGCVFGFIVYSWKRLGRWLKSDTRGGTLSSLSSLSSFDLTEWQSISPFFILIFVILGVYTVANAVNDAATIRYALAITLAYSVGVSVMIEKWTSGKLLGNLFRKERKTLLTSAALLCVLLSNTSSLIGALKIGNEPYFLEPVIAELEKRGLSYGYGDYWYSYSINFLTHEKIIIEPAITNYLPFYMDRVATQKRIAYLDTPPYKQNLNPEIGKEVKIYDIPYRVMDKTTINKVDIYTMEKI